MFRRELRRALRCDELRLHFQPIVRAATGRGIGAEALVRWQHPTLGLLAPGVFLPAAEASGLLPDVGSWVIDRAIAARAGWAAGTTVSINLAPAELAARGTELVDRLVDGCAAAAIAPSDVWVEVTEQPIAQVGPVLAVLRALSHAGVTVALDDLGAGDSSLERLREFPFEVCKLDRSLVAGTSTSVGTERVRSILVELRRTGVRAVAEGVETATQARVLEELGCDLLQGYHLGRPAPDVEVAARLVAWAG